DRRPSPCLTHVAPGGRGAPPGASRRAGAARDLPADAGKTSASRQTLVSGNAARLAAEDLRRKILLLANASPQAKLALSGARLTIGDGEASRTIDLAALASAADATAAPRRRPADLMGRPPQAAAG